MADTKQSNKLHSVKNLKSQGKYRHIHHCNEVGSTNVNTENGVEMQLYLLYWVNQYLHQTLLCRKMAFACLVSSMFFMLYTEFICWPHVRTFKCNEEDNMSGYNSF